MDEETVLETALAWAWLRQWLTSDEAWALLDCLSASRLARLTVLATGPALPARGIATVASQIAGMALQRHLDAGGTIEIPSLGITLGKEDEEAE